MPIELLDGPGDLVERTLAVLAAKGVPKKLRKNSVLAFEDVYGASPEYWDLRYPQGWRNADPEVLRQDPVIVACIKHVGSLYGDLLVSVRLHLDEKTPHVHVVSIPLITQMHKQRGRKRKDGVEPPAVMKTTLYASSIRGGAGRRLEIGHDGWAAAVAHIEIEGQRLVRGKRGSDLTEEERRERTLRDDKASRQGEERARQRARQKAATQAAEADRQEAAELLANADSRNRATAETRNRTAKQIRRARARARAQASSLREDIVIEAARAAGEMISDAQREIDARAAKLFVRERNVAASEQNVAEAIKRAAAAQASAEQALSAAESQTEALARERAAAAAERAKAKADAIQLAEDREKVAADRLAVDADRAIIETAAADALIAERQLALVGRAMVDDTLELALDESARGVKMNEGGMSTLEREAYHSRWSATVRSIARSLARILHNARARIAAAIAKTEESLNAKLQELRVETDKLKAGRKALDRAYIDLELERRAFDRDRKQAQKFAELWKSIPEAERSPAVKKALAAAAPIVSPSKGPEHPDDTRVVALRPPGRGIE